jgi:ankyrin repeat protein
MHGQVDVINDQLAAGVDVHCVDGDGQTALHRCVHAVSLDTGWCGCDSWGSDKCSE